MKTLLLIPSIAKEGLDMEVAADRHPTMDYHALANALRDNCGAQVEMLDYAAVERTHRRCSTGLPDWRQRFGAGMLGISPPEGI